MNTFELSFDHSGLSEKDAKVLAERSACIIINANIHVPFGAVVVQFLEIPIEDTQSIHLIGDSDVKYSPLAEDIISRLNVSEVDTLIIGYTVSDINGQHQVTIPYEASGVVNVVTENNITSIQFQCVSATELLSEVE